MLIISKYSTFKRTPSATVMCGYSASKRHPNSHCNV